MPRLRRPAPSSSSSSSTSSSAPEKQSNEDMTMKERSGAETTPVKADRRGDEKASEQPEPTSGITSTASTASTASSAPTDSSASTVPSSTAKRSRKRRTSLESPDDASTKKTKADETVAKAEVSTHAGVQVLETGHLYFLFRPKVDLAHTTRIEGVQRLLVLMSPDGVSQHWKPDIQATSEAMSSSSSSSSSEATPGAPAAPAASALSRKGKRPAGRRRKGTTASKNENEDEKEKDSAAQQTQHQHQPESHAMTDEPAPSARKKHRLLVIPSKTFPAPVHSRVWAFVERAAESLPPIDQLLEEKTYETATRGQHHLLPVRIAGEAKYQLVKHADSHTHLVYELEIPREPDIVQQAFHIEKSGSFLCMVKNPHVAGLPNHPAPAASERAAFPPPLMERFRGVRKPERKFTALDPTDFLDYEHCELILLHVNRSPADEFPELAHEFDRDVIAEEEHIEQTTHHHPERHVYEDVQLDPQQHPNALHSFV